MTRPYVKSKRADQEAATRQRIVEAAVDLHTTVGPARTTISMIADRAGVQRHTVYAHFPDERGLLMACSGLHAEREALPSPEDWEGVNDLMERLDAALTALYRWFGRNEQLVAAVLRDAEHHALLREVTLLRMGPKLSAIAASLSGGLGPEGHAALALALSFHTWRTLTRDGGMSQTAAAALMARAVLSADGGEADMARTPTAPKPSNDG
jgi:AcrR family transcriptional regulator